MQLWHRHLFGAASIVFAWLQLMGNLINPTVAQLSPDINPSQYGFLTVPVDADKNNIADTVPSSQLATFKNNFYYVANQWQVSAGKASLQAWEVVFVSPVINPVKDGKNARSELQEELLQNQGSKSWSMSGTHVQSGVLRISQLPSLKTTQSNARMVFAQIQNTNGNPLMRLWLISDSKGIRVYSAYIESPTSTNFLYSKNYVSIKLNQELSYTLRVDNGVLSAIVNGKVLDTRSAASSWNTQRLVFTVGSHNQTTTAQGTGSSEVIYSNLKTGHVFPKEAVAPTSQISANPTKLTLGQSSQISWTSNQANCTGSGAWSGEKSGTGTMIVTPTSTWVKTYILECGSARTSTTIEVIPAPTSQISANPTKLTLGQSSQISWTSNQANCTGSGAWSGEKSGTGTMIVTPTETGIYTYELTCGGSRAIAFIEVKASENVSPVQISCEDIPLDIGQPTVLDWGVVYKDIRYGEHARNIFDLYVPRAVSRDDQFPLVLMFHGGGFVNGDKSAYVNNGLDYAKSGIAAISANYQFATRATSSGSEANQNEGVLKSLKDGQRVLQFVRCHASKLGINPDNIVLQGSSAGGSMSLWIGLQDDRAMANSTDPIARMSTRVKGIAANVPQASLDGFYWESHVFKSYTGFTLDVLANDSLNLYNLASYSREKVLTTPAIIDYRKAVDIISFITEDDPEVWASSGEPAVDPSVRGSEYYRGVHHPYHILALRDVIGALGKPGVFSTTGIPNTSISEPSEGRFNFVLRKLWQ